MAGAHQSAEETVIWSPLAQRQFRSLLAASLATNLASVIQGVGTTWVLLGLTSSAALIALHQTASAAPAFLLVLVAGAMTDIVDRRRLLLLALFELFLVALALIVISGLGLASPASILLCVFLLGVGSAFSMPAWAAVVPELVGRGEVAPASALVGTVGSLAAFCGPPLAGLIVVVAGVPALFVVEALLVACGAFLVLIWKRRPAGRRLPAEHLLHALRLGLRYGRYAGPFRSLLLRAALFAVLASAGLALFPLVARLRLGIGAGGLGVLFGLFGGGSAVGALAVPWLRKKLGADVLAAIATITAALGLTALAAAPSFAILGAGLVGLGAGQSALTTGLVTAAQRALPEWVRGRALSIYLFVFYLSTTLGSTAWGIGAAGFGVQPSLWVAALGLAASLVPASRLRLSEAEELDSTPIEWHAMATLVNRPELEDGPVLISVTYHVDPANAAAFAEEMRIAGEHKRRDGAMQWGIYRDVDDPETYVEVFMAATWAEHLRQRERPTRDDLRAWRQAEHLFKVVGVKHFIAPGAWQHARRSRHGHPLAVHGPNRVESLHGRRGRAGRDQADEA